ncbi:hypothetical protein SCOR_15025 [Sulfidibacter corallicola]|uniref:Uncharacterized protein n=1 Tax=Sulfidibacter corallicola TaxID=2818388 RepID=A0A8A4TW97_SULCO|nr:hypothetical protein [Sulfidibacter corallicola]QTD54219.1 hypothetical protein J3U87_17375 [Sulfidibacter corallicola]
MSQKIDQLKNFKNKDSQQVAEFLREGLLRIEKGMNPLLESPPYLIVQAPKKGRRLQIHDITDPDYAEAAPMPEETAFWKRKHDEAREELFKIQVKAERENRSGFSRKIAIALVAIFFITTAGTAEFIRRGVFDVRKNKGTKAALSLAESNKSPSPRQEYEQAFLLFFDNRRNEAKSLAWHALKTGNPEVRALCYHLLGMIFWDEGNRELGHKYFYSALDYDGLTDLQRAGILISLGRRLRDQDLLAEAVSMIDEENPGYWKIQAGHARAQVDLSTDAETGYQWALLGAEACRKTGDKRKLAWFLKDISTWEAILSIAPSFSSMEAQQIAVEMQDSRLWHFTLIPEALIAKQNGDDIRYSWIIGTLDAYLARHPNSMLQANTEYVKEWSP